MTNENAGSEVKPARLAVIKRLLDVVAEKTGLGDSYTFDLIAGCEKGDGYAGEKHIAVLTGANGNVKPIKVFIKGSPTHEGFSNFLESMDIFLTEITFYDHIYPALDAFQRENQIADPFLSVIQPLVTNSEKGHEILVLQNARDLGFELWERSKQMNGEYAAFVFREYGKFHGVAYGLKTLRPEVYNGLLVKLNPEYNVMKVMADVMSNSLKSLAEKAKPLFDTEEEPEICASLNKFVDGILDFLNTRPHEEDNCTVITHGDCWFNNMMFKFENNDERTKPSEMLLIDFQLCRPGSPVCDLSYFLYASCSKDVYNDLDTYLAVYYESLSKTLQDVGVDPETVITFDELKRQWRKHCLFGFCMALLVLKIAVAEKDERKEISEVLDESDDPLSGFTADYKNDHVYHQRLRELIRHLHENKFFDYENYL